MTLELQVIIMILVFRRGLTRMITFTMHETNYYVSKYQFLEHKQYDQRRNLLKLSRSMWIRAHELLLFCINYANFLIHVN